jgi:hypothetical protein
VLGLDVLVVEGADLPHVPLRLASKWVFERKHFVVFLVLLGDQVDDLLDTRDVRGASQFFAKNLVFLLGGRQNLDGVDLELDEFQDVLKDGHDGLASELPACRASVLRGIGLAMKVLAMKVLLLSPRP